MKANRFLGGKQRNDQQPGSAWAGAPHHLLALTILLFVSTTSSASTIEPVSELHVPAYVGRWYQMLASLTVKDTMELGGNCVIADYGLLKNRSDAISVANTCEPFGHTVVVGGFATANPAKQGEFDVALGRPGHPAPRPVPYTKSNYVVAALGSIVDGKYEWAVVTDPRMVSLYVLARNVTRFQNEQEAEARRVITKLGFTKLWNKPHATNQERCVYPPPLPAV